MLFYDDDESNGLPEMDPMVCFLPLAPLARRP